MLINCINYRGKTWLQASQLMKILRNDDDSEINTTLFLKTIVPDENKVQINGKNTWFVDATGAGMLLMEGSTVASKSIKDKLIQSITDFMNVVIESNLSLDNTLEINPNDEINTNCDIIIKLHTEK